MIIPRALVKSPPPSLCHAVAQAVDTVLRRRYVPAVVLRIVGSLLGLFVAGCVGYVSFTYCHAFWNRRHSASPAQLARAALVESGACLLFTALLPFWWLFGASYQAAVEGEGEARGGRHPVVLVHGLAMNHTNWLWLGRGLARRGCAPLYAFSFFSLGRMRRSAERLARFVEQVRRRESAEAVDIVAHSLGGVVARYYLERLGGAAHVGRLITIGTPHFGTKLARFGAFVPAALELRVDSSFLTEMGPPRLNDGVRYTSVWSRADAMIEPPESASLHEAGCDRVFDDLGHLSLLLSPRVFDVVADRLQA